MVVRLTFIVADLTRSFFGSVDTLLPTATCRMVSATEAFQMSPSGLRHLDVFSMVEDYREGGGVEMDRVEQARRMMAPRMAQSS